MRQINDDQRRKPRFWEHYSHSVIGGGSLDSDNQNYDLSNYVYPHEEHYDYKDKIFPNRYGYINEALLPLKRIFIIVICTASILFLVGCLLIIHTTATTIQKQLPIQHTIQDGKVCGQSYTHDGTPIVLHFQTDTTFDVTGKQYTSTNCGY